MKVCAQRDGSRVVSAEIAVKKFLYFILPHIKEREKERIKCAVFVVALSCLLPTVDVRAQCPVSRLYWTSPVPNITLASSWFMDVTLFLFPKGFPYLPTPPTSLYNQTFYVKMKLPHSINQHTLRPGGQRLCALDEPSGEFLSC